MSQAGDIKQMWRDSSVWVWKAAKGNLECGGSDLPRVGSQRLDCGCKQAVRSLKNLVASHLDGSSESALGQVTLVSVLQGALSAFVSPARIRMQYGPHAIKH